MVKIMVVAKFPPHKINELIKNYTSTDKPAYPDFLYMFEEKIKNL